MKSRGERPSEDAEVPEAVFDYVEQQRIALDAEVALRTLQRALRGENVRPSSLHRIRRALAARGLIDVLPNGVNTPKD
jgi:hypothetical protein